MGGSFFFSVSPNLPISLIFLLSDCPDLLPHKDEIADSKTEETGGDDGNKIWRDDDEALQKWKGVLKSR